ncbi:MAG: DUF5606 domain-containing protein [Alloprevotella sp.]|nr:DUF5606 domain-containing protein [Alloprevotella sp.]
MKETILAIAGRPGLFRLLAQGRNNLIVETIDDQKKRIPAGARDRVTSLNDVSMYTDEEDVRLMQVFQNLSQIHGGKPVALSHKTATDAELEAFMAEALPKYDRDRVRHSDMRKLLQWYNILVTNGYTDFSDNPEAENTEEA